MHTQLMQLNMHGLVLIYNNLTLVPGLLRFFHTMSGTTVLLLQARTLGFRNLALHSGLYLPRRRRVLRQECSAPAAFRGWRAAGR